MFEFIKTEEISNIGIITLNRPDILNAWHKPMRDEIAEALEHYESDQVIRAIIMTGTGDRAFCAGQDFEEAKNFDPHGAELWIEEWRSLYGLIRSLTIPLIAALNGIAAGSGFQVALLADIRIGHPEVTMGQPEINSGILSITGPWIMREMLGLSRTIELTLTGRMMDAQECQHIGLIHKLVPREELMNEAISMARMLAKKPPVAMRLDKQRFQEVTEASFQEALDAAVRYHHESYATGEPQAIMKKFLEEHAARRKG
ncbi:MAG: enoyl-CoA hydratase/isomerase family protein [Desulfobacterales bacterium]